MIKESTITVLHKDEILFKYNKFPSKGEFNAMKESKIN